jgi:rhodanese-related sulfurtransferase
MKTLIQFINNHWQLWLALFIVLGILIFEEIKSIVFGAQRLTPEKLALLMNHEDTVIIDIRETTEFESGHILNARNIPQKTFDDEINNIAQHKNKSTVIVDNNGTKATAAYNKLKRLGLEKIYILMGGINSWKNTNLPLVKGK